MKTTAKPATMVDIVAEDMSSVVPVSHDAADERPRHIAHTFTADGVDVRTIDGPTYSSGPEVTYAAFRPGAPPVVDATTPSDPPEPARSTSMRDVIRGVMGGR